MRYPCVPSGVLPVKELHTPGLFPTTQPAALSGALSRNGGIGDTQLPVGLPSHVNLPVMATEAEALQAEDIEGGVKASREVRKLLPGVRVGSTVTMGGDDQLRVSRVWIQPHLTRVWRQQTYLPRGIYKI